MTEQGATVPPYASETLLRLHAPACPEDRLMLAVLLDAVAVLREHATGVSPHPPRFVASTARWFTMPDASWPLSFVNVCRTLGLDPDGLLRGLRRELADLGARGLLDPEGARVVTLYAVRPATRVATPVHRRAASRSRG